MSLSAEPKNILLIKRLYLYLQRDRNMRLKRLGITASQSDTMMYIYDNAAEREIHQRDIEEYLMVSNPTVSGIIRRLEEKGLISCAQSASDARSKALSLTAQGAAVMDEIMRRGRAVNEYRLIDGMDDGEQRQFTELLARALRNIEKSGEK